MEKLSKWLYRGSSVPTMVLAIAAYAWFLAFVMVPEGDATTAFAGDWSSPDSHFFYTPDELYSQLSTWGDAGRDHYVAFRLGLDPVWALVYTAFLVTTTGVALRFAFPATDRRRLLNIAAVVPMLADLAENALGMLLVSSYPERWDAIAWVTASVSAFKWTTLTIAHLVMLYALGAALASRLQARTG